MTSIKITLDNSKAIKKAKDEAVERALTAAGMQCEGYAKMLCPVDTGLLRNSITNAVSGENVQKEYHGDNPSKYGKSKNIPSGKYNGSAPAAENGKIAVYIGTNVEYAPYVEEGHLRADGTHVAPKRFIKPALYNHADEYKKIIETFLKGAMQ